MENPTKELRLKYKKIRNEINKETAALASKECCSKVFDYIISSGFNVVLCFYPTSSEINLMPLYERLLAEGIRLFFPVTKGLSMDFFEVKDLKNDFIIGDFGIMVPKSTDVIYSYKFCGAAFVITPGLVFDRNMNRIGYGKGFYDRFFYEKNYLFKAGVCFEAQLSTEIKSSVYDVPMDLIITEREIYK